MLSLGQERAVAAAHIRKSVLCLGGERYTRAVRQPDGQLPTGEITLAKAVLQLCAKVCSVWLTGISSASNCGIRQL